MSAESQGFDPYEAVLADLRAKRDQIDQAIAAIESIRGGAAAASPGPTRVAGEAGLDAPGVFHGLTIPEAAKKLLGYKRQNMRNPEIAAEFKARGYILNSADPVNTIGSVLTRRANEVGDIVKVARGTWGLKEWYPNRSFGKKESGKPDNGEKQEEAQQERTGLPPGGLLANQRPLGGG